MFEHNDRFLSVNIDMLGQFYLLKEYARVRVLSWTDGNKIAKLTTPNEVQRLYLFEFKSFQGHKYTFISS